MKKIIFGTAIAIIFAAALPASPAFFLKNYLTISSVFIIAGIFLLFLLRLCMKLLLSFSRKHPNVFPKLSARIEKYYPKTIALLRRIIKWLLIFLGVLAALIITLLGVDRFRYDAYEKQLKQLPTNIEINNESIGVATMAPDGTIILDLRARGADGTAGDARLTYSKNHRDYQKILDHLGGLRPGEQKSVLPWPDVDIPNTQEGVECLNKGGKWEKFGLRLKEECDLPTADAGKTCTDSSQCESGCFADRVGATSGRCGSSTVIVGCGLIFVENGQSAGGALCAD